VRKEMSSSVIRKLEQRTETGFGDPIYLAPEQRFVGALRNSSVHNMEEQYILGTDTYTDYSLDENGNTLITKSFYQNNSLDHYELESIIYKEDSIFDIDGNALQLQDNFNNVLIDKSGDYSTTFVLLRVDRLYYIKSNVKNFIWEKQTQKKYVKDENDNITNVVYTETISDTISS
jgi:hypothetical protein